jgi:hypothetical protein
MVFEFKKYKPMGCARYLKEWGRKQEKSWINIEKDRM